MIEKGCGYLLSNTALLCMIWHAVCIGILPEPKLDCVLNSYADLQHSEYFLHMKMWLLSCCYVRNARL